jgi:acetyl-CoA carboxylase biotin carboxyl carrier protein
MPIESLCADTTGKVWKVLVQPGQLVQEDECLVIVESMKMEIPVTAHCAGRVVSILVAEGDDVTEGQEVATVEI